MASLTKRATILIICRVFNYGVLALSPMFLVRIFDVHSYGQYREFMLYAVLLAGIIEFTVNTNLIYFIPKYPGREGQSVTHTEFLILVASTIGLAAVYLLRGIILARTSYDFIAPLILFLFFNLNFEFFENYWLGRKRIDYVLFYSSARVTVRTVALIVSAYLSRDVMTVIHTLIAVEMAKCLFVFIMLRKDLTFRIDRALIKEQLRFILPLGSAVVINLVNNQLGNLVISIKMGVERLALYGIGSTQIPILNIVSSSATDVLFPEMAQIDDAPRLRLWQRANVIFCFIVFPVYVVFFFYAHTVIETLFTKNYIAAVPLFRIYLTLILVQSFDMGTPLRTINQNRYFILGSVLSLAANIGLLLMLFRQVGFILPALAFVLGESIKNVYLGSRILHFYRIKLGGLFLWRKIMMITCCAALAIPALIISTWIDMNAVAKAMSFSTLYLVAYYVVLRRFRLDEVELIVEKVRKRFRRS